MARENCKVEVANVDETGGGAELKSLASRRSRDARNFFVRTKRWLLNEHSVPFRANLFGEAGNRSSESSEESQALLWVRHGGPKKSRASSVRHNAPNLLSTSPWIVLSQIRSPHVAVKSNLPPFHAKRFLFSEAVRTSESEKAFERKRGRLSQIRFLSCRGCGGFLSGDTTLSDHSLRW